MGLFELQQFLCKSILYFYSVSLSYAIAWAKWALVLRALI